jgi:hypothetical protein
MWRSLAVFRLVALAYAVGTVGRDLGQGEHPAFGIVWFGAVAVWSAVVSLLVPAAEDGGRRRWRDGLVVADVVLCTAIMLTTRAVSPPGSTDVLPALWTASGVYASPASRYPTCSPPTSAPSSSASDVRSPGRHVDDQPRRYRCPLPGAASGPFSGASR